MKPYLPLLLVALTPACGSADSEDSLADAGNGEADTSGDAAAEAYLQWRGDANRASCAREQRCDAPPEHDSIEACLDDLDDNVVAAAPRIADSIRRGDTHFFADWAEQCLAAYDFECERPTTDRLMICNRVYDGQLEQGDACVGHFECLNEPGPDRLLCFDGCDALWGYEDELGSGQCVAESPVGSPQCD